MERIIVGVDTSESARAALAWADREAELREASLTAVMAWGLLDQQHEDLDAPFDPEYGDAEARQALDAIVVRAVAPIRAARVGRRPVCDLPFRALLDAGRDADLLVVGSRGRGGFTGLLLGSVSQQVLHHAPCPTAIVRTVERRSAGKQPRILVGIDGSAASHRALRWAVEEARLRAARLVVVHAWPMPYALEHPGFGSPLASAGFEDAAQVVLDAALAEVDTAELSDPVEQIHRLGSPAHALIEAGADADLIVVGSRGLGGFPGLLLGSVSNQLAHHAPCPLVVIPAA